MKTIELTLYQIEAKTENSNLSYTAWSINEDLSTFFVNYVKEKVDTLEVTYTTETKLWNNSSTFESTSLTLQISKELSLYFNDPFCLNSIIINSSCVTNLAVLSVDSRLEFRKGYKKLNGDYPTVTDRVYYLNNERIGNLLELSSKLDNLGVSINYYTLRAIAGSENIPKSVKCQYPNFTFIRKDLIDSPNYLDPVEAPIRKPNYKGRQKRV